MTLRTERYYLMRSGILHRRFFDISRKYLLIVRDLMVKFNISIRNPVECFQMTERTEEDLILSIYP